MFNFQVLQAYSMRYTPKHNFAGIPELERFGIGMATKYDTHPIPNFNTLYGPHHNR